MEKQKIYTAPEIQVLHIIEQENIAVSLGSGIELPDHEFE